MLKDAARGQEHAAVGRDILLCLGDGHILGKHLFECGVCEGVEVELVGEFAIVPHIARQDGRRAWMRLGILRREHSNPIVRRAGTEGIDGSLRAIGRGDQQIARFVEGEIDRVEGIVAFDGEALGLRPAEDALLMVIDEVELSGRVHGRAGDGKESAFELFDLGARRQHGR